MKSPGLELGYWKTRVKNKKPELQDFLYGKNNIDIIWMHETHLTEPQRFFVRGYEPFRQDGTNRVKSDNLDSGQNLSLVGRSNQISGTAN